MRRKLLLGGSFYQWPGRHYYRGRFHHKSSAFLGVEKRIRETREHDRYVGAMLHECSDANLVAYPFERKLSIEEQSSQCDPQGHAHHEPPTVPECPQQQTTMKIIESPLTVPPAILGLADVTASEKLLLALYAAEPDARNYRALKVLGMASRV